MSTQKPTIYNKTNYSTGSKTLTLDEANKLFYSKNSQNLTVPGTVTSANDIVYGHMSTSTLSATNAVVLGQSNSSHVIFGTTTTKGVLNVQDADNNNIIQANNSAISLGKLPRMTTTITPSDPLDLVTKAYADGSNVNILPLNNAWTGTNTYSVLPTCTTLATSNSQMANKQYVDTLVNSAGLKSATNAWTGTNTFNSNLPTSTQTPTSNTQLTTKTYVDNTVNSLKTSANTWSAKQTVNNALNLSTSHAGNYYDGNGNSVTPFTITDIDTGNNTNSNVAFIINGSNGSSQMLAATGQVGGAFMRLNTWSNDANGVSIGSNYTRIEGGTNHLTVDKTNGITMKVNPKIDSYILPSNDLEIVPKKYVDDSIANKKTFITTAGKGPTDGLNVVDNASSKGTIVVPYAGAGNYNPSVMDGSTAIIARSNTVDTSSLCIAPHSSTNTGIQLSTNSINIGCGGLGASAETNINIDGSSGIIQFSKVPILTNDLTSSITDNKNLTTKKYVDDKVATVTKTSLSLQNIDNTADVDKPVSVPQQTYVDRYAIPRYVYRQNTKLFHTGISATQYGLEAPYVGANAVPNSMGFVNSIYLRSPLSERSTVYGAFPLQTLILEIDYYFTPSKAITGAINYDAAETNKVQRSTPFTPADASIPSTLFGAIPAGYPATQLFAQHTNSVFSVTITPGIANTVLSPATLNVVQLRATRSMWNNASVTKTGTTNITYPVTKATSIVYSHFYNNGTYNCVPIYFELIDKDTLQIIFNFPNSKNSPTKDGWISSLGYDITVRNAPASNDNWYFTSSATGNP
jgi:hypothetical protein